MYCPVEVFKCKMVCLGDLSRCLLYENPHTLKLTYIGSRSRNSIIW